MDNKLSKPFCIKTWASIIFLIIVCRGNTQDSTVQKPPVMDNWKEYLGVIAKDPGKKMVDLQAKIPAIVFDLRYSSANNFMNRQMYDPAPVTSFLRAPAADALAKAQTELAASGLGLKIFDAYRPWSVTARFWELVKDERYVANPARGSGHNRGIAVDLTIIRLDNDTELPMGTGFDNFSDTAHHGFGQLPLEVLNNRKLLRSTMEKYGFKALETEWWHYFLPDAGRFELLDLSFKQLQQKP